jgi:hypothetical protein
MPTLNLAELIPVGMTSIGQEEVIRSLKKDAANSFGDVVHKAITQKNDHPKTVKKSNASQSLLKNGKSGSVASAASSDKSQPLLTNGQAPAQKVTKSVAVLKIRTPQKTASSLMTVTNPTVNSAKTDVITGSIIPNSSLTVNVQRNKGTVTVTNGNEQQLSALPVSTEINPERVALSPAGSRLSKLAVTTSRLDQVDDPAIATGPSPLSQPVLTENVEKEPPQSPLQNLKTDLRKTVNIGIQSASVNQTGSSSDKINHTSENIEGKTDESIRISDGKIAQAIKQSAMGTPANSTENILSTADPANEPENNRITTDNINEPKPADFRSIINKADIQTATDIKMDFSVLDKTSAENSNAYARVNEPSAGKVFLSANHNATGLTSAPEIVRPPLQASDETSVKETKSVKPVQEFKTPSVAESRPVKLEPRTYITKETLTPNTTETAISELTTPEKPAIGLQSQNNELSAKFSVRHVSQDGPESSTSISTNDSTSGAIVNVKADLVRESSMIGIDNHSKNTDQTRVPISSKVENSGVQPVKEPESGNSSNSDAGLNQARDKKTTEDNSYSEKSMTNRTSAAQQFSLKNPEPVAKTGNPSVGSARLAGSSFVQQLGEQINLAVTATPRMTNIAVESATVGKIEVQFSRDTEEKKATIVVESQEVSDQIQKIMPSIVENLSQKGIQFAALDVQVRNFNDNRKKEKEPSWPSDNTQQNNLESDPNLPINKPSIRNYGYNTIEYVA